MNDIPAQVIHTLVEWIEDNLDKPLRIEDVARHAGYSRWHLQRLFARHTGHNLARYIRERKLALAANDLRNSNDPLATIWMKYGYESQQAFTRVFSREFAQPPGMYRKNANL